MIPPEAVAEARAGRIARVRALLAALPEGRELETAKAAIDVALLAVVEARLAGVPDAMRPSPHLLKVIADGCVADLGFSWSRERMAAASPEEKVAHQAIQSYWLLVAVGDVQ